MSSSLKKAVIVMTVAFAIFFFGIAHMVTSAFQAYEPPSDPAYHEKGLDIQKCNDEFNRAIQRGWSVEIPLLDNEALTMGRVRLTIILTQNQVAPITKTETKLSSESLTRKIDRPAVKIAIYRPATMIGAKEYVFNESSLKQISAGQFQFSEEIEIPQYESKKIEVAIEVRPESDSAIYRSKRFELK